MTEKDPFRVQESKVVLTHIGWINLFSFQIHYTMIHMGTEFRNNVHHMALRFATLHHVE